jgi:ProP effector
MIHDFVSACGLGTRANRRSSGSFYQLFSLRASATCRACHAILRVPVLTMKSMNTNSSAAASPEVTEAQAAPTSASAATEAAAPAVSLSPRALLKQLQQQFPAFGKCLPLDIGIDKQLLARMPGLDRKTMRAALGIHTGSLRYLKAMEKATVRYDLDGKPGAEVTDTHRAHAKEVLQQRFKKEADRKRSEREAAAAEEAARLRQEKLQALASKFSRN